MLRTAQFIDTYFPVIDGVIRTVYNYAYYLNEQTDYCCVFAPRYKGYKDDDSPFDVFRTAGLKIPFIGYSYSMPKLSKAAYDVIKTKDFDLFHAHSPFQMGYYALSMGHKMEIPVVATFHSKYYDDFKRVTKSEVMAQLVVDTIVKFYEKVDSVWSVNRGTAGTLRDYSYKGDIFVINNGTDMVYPDDADKLIEEARSRFGLPEDKKLILFTGHLIWQKNLKLILDTIKLLAGARRDFLMIFVGTGYNEKEIKKYAEELELEPYVRFLGQIEDRKLLQGMYGAATLFFFPSVYDNAPLVVREAAVMKLPSLLADDANAAEGVEDGSNGFTAPPEAEDMFAKLNALLDDLPALKLAGERASETIPIPWEKLVSEVAVQYMRICAEYKLKHKSGE